jgi:DNA-damage-inducible protein D
MTETHLAVFKGKKIRRTLHNNEWWFSVVDVVGVLTDSPDAGAYWRKLKQRLKEEGSEVVTFCHGLKLPASDGKNYETDCANQLKSVLSLLCVMNRKMHNTVG